MYVLKAAREEILLPISTGSEEERKKCNVNGKSNKKQLSPKRMGKIFSAVFQMYPKTQKETEKEAWADCVKVIDVANRALNRKRGKEN